MATPIETSSKDAITRPENTRPVVAIMVYNTASGGLVPPPWPAPICHRFTVLKNLAWSAMEPIKICGGGSNLASAQPTAQSASHIPANNPIDAAPHSTVGATAATEVIQ